MKRIIAAVFNSHICRLKIRHTLLSKLQLIYNYELSKINKLSETKNLNPIRESSA